MTRSIKISNHNDICVGRKSIKRDLSLPTHKNFVRKYPYDRYILNFDNYKYFNVIKLVDTRSNTEYKIKSYLIDNVYMYSVDDILHSFKPNDDNVLTSFFDSQHFKDILKHYSKKYIADEDNDNDNDIQEIISNSIDEFIMGYGDRIDITLYPDNYISIRDYGRGVPFGIRDNGENVLEAIYSHAHTGGKFNDKDYQFAVGLNG